jgi:enediyne polyketide synthase
MAPIAIVGMACRYPDADSPGALWENVLAQRRAFRRLPAERLCREDYFSADRGAPDCTYAAEAALIEGYEFDRVGFRVVGSTFRSADLAHWLALDVAAQALADAGFPDGEGLPRTMTGVLMGNTLTGEFSRANVLRLRWPYVRRVVEAALLEKGWSPEQRREFLDDLETPYKAPFPPVGEETLAGGLSNTIAGRICNYFDLKGGGYTVDGACASSLLAVATACSGLVAGDLDVALAGGVDLSLDPFELVGFAKAGALAEEEMRVYDARSAGFWPGEGCGVVVLMRHADAIAQGRRIYAVIRGWGISSDGSGGITRPEVEGQLLAVQRAYRRAGFGIQTAAYFEGHGTGTSVGDATELRMLSRARREAAPQGPPAVISSIKANIGHTKAAAGIAGLIKATMALHAQILPPTTGCEEPHPELAGESPALRVLREGEPWPTDHPLRAGVSAMGFGGINTHVVLEGPTTQRRPTISPQEHTLLTSRQDAELLLLGAADAEGLRRQVDHLASYAAKLSRAEVGDLAAQLERTLGPRLVRAAVVASSPAELAGRLKTLSSWLANGVATRLDTGAGLFLSAGVSTPRIAFLFPGQGSPSHLEGGALRRRFEFVRDLYARADLPQEGDATGTAIAQPAIVTASLAGLRTLEQLGVSAHVAVGHSLGELTALHWAGALDEEALLRIARARGKAMAELGSPTGAMAGIAAGRNEVQELLNGDSVVQAGLNSPRQTVISGQTAAVAAVVTRARTRGWTAVTLPVSHAFHSSLVAGAVPALAEHLSREDFRPLRRTVVSTVTGTCLSPREDLRTLLCRQVTLPVRFVEAASAALEGIDLLIEVGPGHVLSGLVRDLSDTPVVATDAGGPSLKGLLHAVGVAYVLGASVNHRALFAGRFTRPFNLNWHPRFFANPCELAPLPETLAHQPTKKVWRREDAAIVARSSRPPRNPSPLELVRQLVAERAELPPAAVKDDTRLLDGLHLNSIAVGQLVAEASRRHGLPPPAAPTDYANATVAEIARALEDRLRTGATPVDTNERVPAGVDSWIRAFTVELVERPLPRRQVPSDAVRSAPLQRGGPSQPPEGGHYEPGWQLISPANYPLRAALQEAISQWGASGGVMLCLPPEPDERHIDFLLQAARAVLNKRGAVRFVLVQHGGGGAAFARTLHLEAPEVTTCVVDVPVDHPQAVEWVRAEALAAVGYSEAYYDASGSRREPVLRLCSLSNKGAEPLLGAKDVLLVTGGGKGIAAECALSLARSTGVRLALLGRSEPAADAELAANLERMTAAGVEFRYFSADVTDAQAVGAAVGQVEKTLGPVTAILHGAGTNVPRLLNSLDETAFRHTLAPKVQGARNVLAAVDPARLRLLITFGSIIARTGMRGEADYAVANEWLARLTERWQVNHPHCRCLTVEWSVWSGVGMGQRLGRIDALLQQGITPIPPDEGVRLLHGLLAQRLPAVSLVVTGRFGDPPTLKLERPELPLLRFLEQPRVYYPGVELIAEAKLSAETDPYLNDHVFRGDKLLPAVLGLEAMAQATMALMGTTEPPAFKDVKFTLPVAVPKDRSVTIRVAALVREPGCVEVVLRSEETAFSVDHFRATCCVGLQNAECRMQNAECPCILHSAFCILQSDDLYGGILFHSGRFRRLRGYRRLRARECLAEIAPGRTDNWFGRYLPAQLVLGDPAGRDAAIHAIQACIPHETILPTGVGRLVIDSAQPPGPRWVHARERLREGKTFIYDMEVTGADGAVLERWEGLRLHIAESMTPQEAWPAPLLGPYLERRIRELSAATPVEVVVEQGNAAERHAQTNAAVQSLLGPKKVVHRRPDGKPEVDGHAVSAAHAGNLTLAVSGASPIGCDIEAVVQRPAPVWQELLGPERFALAGILAREACEEEAVAATRVWAAEECLKKAGSMVATPLVLNAVTADGWVLLQAGRLVIATFAAPVKGVPDRLVLAVLVRSEDASV